MDYPEIAESFQSGGAGALSVVISPDCDDFIKDLLENTDIPCIADDVISDEYMIYHYKLLGFSAVMLKVDVLEVVDLKRFYDLAYSLGMSCIFEVKDSSDISKAMIVGGDIICADSNIENAISLRRCVSHDLTFIVKGSVKSKEDVIKLKENNIHAIILNDSSIKIDEISQ